MKKLTPEQVKAKLATARNDCNRTVRAANEAFSAVRDSIRERCPHTFTAPYTDAWGFHESSKCVHCGIEASKV